jgi:hypothetical protein
VYDLRGDDGSSATRLITPAKLLGYAYLNATYLRKQINTDHHFCWSNLHADANIRHIRDRDARLTHKIANTYKTVNAAEWSKDIDIKINELQRLKTWEVAKISPHSLSLTISPHSMTMAVVCYTFSQNF